MLDIQTGRRSTALEFLQNSCIYLGCRAGRSKRHVTVCVYVCVNDAMGLNSGAIRLEDVASAVTSERPFFDMRITQVSPHHLT